MNAHSSNPLSTNTNHIDYAALSLRIALGVMFVAHGWLKYSVFTMAGAVGFFESVGLSGWLAYPVTIAEILGGLALLAGVQTRLVAIGLIPITLGAVVVHMANGWVFSAPDGGWEYPAFLAAASLVLALLGGGRYALTGDLDLTRFTPKLRA